MLSRRLFIIIPICFLACVAITPAAVSSADNDVTVAFLSDTHIPASQAPTPPRNHFYFDPQGNLIKALNQAMKINPRAVIITGDIARLTGQKEDYARFGELITPYARQTPFYPAMGNHDSRINFTASLKDTRNSDYVNDKYIRILNLDFVKIINLDSMKETNYAPGHLGTDQLSWLERYLDEYNDKAVILCLHHPPGERSLEDHEEFMDIVLRHNKVKAVIFGHSHNCSFKSVDGLHLVNLPAVAYSFSEKTPVGWIRADLNARQGTFTFNIIDGKDKTPEMFPEKILNWR